MDSQAMQKRLNAIKKALPWGIIFQAKQFICDNFGHAPDWKNHYHATRKHPAMKDQHDIHTTCKRCKLFIIARFPHDIWHQSPRIDEE